MPRIPLINDQTGVVDNVIMAEYTDPAPPGYYLGPPGGEIGWIWNGAGYTDPNPPPPPTPMGPPDVEQ